jgi:glucose/arabinose dehydrogenase/cytochrome c551/c552
MNAKYLLVLCVILLSTSALADEAVGALVYQQNCAACHGLERKGGVGPNLADQEWLKVKPEQDALVQFIGKGSAATGMPAWSGLLDKEKISAVAAFLLNPTLKSDVAKVNDPYPELKKLRLPVGFSISVYTDQVENARAMVVAPSGVVFVASRTTGKVFAVVDNNKDYIIDKVVTVVDGLDSPIGVTYLNGALFIAERYRVVRIDDIDKTYMKKPKWTVVKDDFPQEKWHGEKIIKAGQDGKLYIPIGAPCNVCDKENEPFAKIYRMNPDGSDFEIYAKGIRNSVGFAWEPKTKELWFTDNGRDLMGDNMPSCELNRAPKAGMHFGFPYCHGGVVLDPEFGKGRSCDEFVSPEAKLGPHVAPLGLAFYEGSQFPEAYRYQLFVAEHGSWNRTQKIGYRVELITIVNNQVVTDTPFIEGFLQGNEVLGRPVDVAFLQDGSMLISDDFRGRLYRVIYSAPAKN